MLKKQALNVMANRASLQASNANASMNLLNAKNGLVVEPPLSFYFIYYGDFSATSVDGQTPALVKQYIQDSSNTPYLNTVSQYTSGTTGKPTTTTIYYAGASFITGYPYGKVLATTTDTCVANIVKSAINSFNIPLNTNTQYYLITSSDVSFSTAVCDDTNNACGYHTFFPKYNNVEQVLYGWIGSDQGGCFVNGPYNGPANTVVNVFSHEVFETLTDPYIDAWNNQKGNEIGDLCNFNFGSNQLDSKISTSGGKYNIILNGHEYLVQLEWSNLVADCVLFTNFTGTTPPTAVSASPAVLPSLVPGVSQSGSNAPLVFPSNDPSLSTGASQTQTLQPRASQSVNPTLSTFPSLNPTTGVCVSCFEPICRSYKRIQKLCQTTLQGTFTLTNSTSLSVAAKTCCTNMKNPSASFHWIQTGIPNCEYGGIPTKKLLWCEALGGHVTCDDSLAATNGVKYTCNRS